MKPLHGLQPITLALRALLHASLISQTAKGKPWTIDDKAWNLSPEKEAEVIQAYLNYLDE